MLSSSGSSFCHPHNHCHMFQGEWFIQATLHVIHSLFTLNVLFKLPRVKAKEFLVPLNKKKIDFFINFV